MTTYYFISDLHIGGDEPLSRPQRSWDVLPPLQPSLADRERVQEHQARLLGEDFLEGLLRPTVLFRVRSTEQIPGVR